MPAYLMVSMAVMSFSMAYLHPQFKQKDERMQLIRYKGLFYSFFAMLIYMFALLTLLEAGVNLTASMVIQMLIALNICTVFLSWVILSKKM
ncbi:permease [Bacillus sp. SB49]|nr:permease [Bacillus sp. SB49]